MSQKNQYILVLLLLPIFIITIYYPGLSGGFVFDDSSNILLLPDVAMNELSWSSLKSAALSMEGRPIARASFGLNHLASGFNPYYFKMVNLAIHSINALLVFTLISLILKVHVIARKPVGNEAHVILIAFAVALAWALHPVNLTNVLYSVQRMNSLSALFVLAGMIVYIKGRNILEIKPTRGWVLIYASVLLFLPLGWLSKENAALLPLFLFLIELTFFRFSTSQNRHRIGLYLFFTLFLLLPVLLLLIYIIEHPGMFHGGYNNRYFSLAERLLTEPRVIWLYIRMILLPAPSVFGLFHDDVSISTSLTEPITTSFALIGLVSLVAVALAVIKRAPILAFGLLFFVAGHLMESSFIPLELVFEHRNYLPSIGLLLTLFYYLGYAGKAEKHTKSRIALMTLFITLFALQTHLRARQWSDTVRLYLTDVQYHPKSARANYEAGKVFGQRLERGQGDPKINYREAIKYFERNTSLRDNTTSGLFGSLLASIDSGNKIQPAWIDELEHRLNTQPLEQVNLLWLDKMTDCIKRGKCNKEEIQLPRLLKAVIGYSKVSSKNKSMAYGILAKYAYMVEGNRLEAVELAGMAVSTMPSNMYHQLNMVKYLIGANQLVNAEKYLASVAKLDIYGQHVANIASLKKTLENKQYNLLFSSPQPEPFLPEKYLKQPAVPASK